MSAVRVISLFSGAGGLDLGFKQAGYSVDLAIDNSSPAIDSHRHNFPATKSITADLLSIGPEGVLEYVETVLDDGDQIGIIGGPPCQGFSRANSSSSASDPRNALPATYLDIVELLQDRYKVRFALFENVLGIKDKKHETAFSGILSRLGDLGFTSTVEVYKAEEFGVPQKRRRVIISAFQDRVAATLFRPLKDERPVRTVRDALHGLPEPVYFSPSLTPDAIPFHPNHWTMAPRSSRFTTDQHKLATSGRSFRRLVWDEPSPTVAYGNREIHVHPNGHRRLSIYEAMLLQGFPHSFALKGTLSAQVQQVSNAVPPPLARSLAAATDIALVGAE